MNDISQTESQGAEQHLERYRKHRVWYIILSLILIVLGVVGAYYSATVTAVAMIWIGILLITAGVLQFIYAFSAKGWKGLFFHIFLSLIALAAGIFIIAYPLKASVIFTFFIACYLIAAGILRIILAFNIKEYAAWWFILIAGLISLTLGVLILTHWPVSGLWIIGFFVSIEVVLSGLSMLCMSLAAKG